MQDNNI
ncbi:hypothetical protein AX774_g7431, partial [Zancudomyces culisetae]